MLVLAPHSATPNFKMAVQYLAARPLILRWHTSLPGAVIAHWGWVSDWGRAWPHHQTFNYAELPWSPLTATVGRRGHPTAYGWCTRFMHPTEFVEAYLQFYGDMFNHDATTFFHAMQDIDCRGSRAARWAQIEKLWEGKIAGPDCTSRRGILEGY